MIKRNKSFKALPRILLVLPLVQTFLQSTKSLCSCFAPQPILPVTSSRDKRKGVSHEIYSKHFEYASRRRWVHLSSTAGLESTEASDVISADNVNGNNHKKIHATRDSKRISNNATRSSELLETSSIISPYAAQTLDGRLLCSSQCAYEISSPYFRGASYRPGTVAKRITRGVNSALIGHTTDGITIAFRGTQTTSHLDWLQNAALFLSDVDEEKYKIQGKIHAGFYRGTKSMWKPLRAITKEMIQEAEDNGWSKDIYLTGHSKGGAMASIAALLLKRDPNLPDPTYVCTFASARVGDSQFRDAYNERIHQTTYEAHLDLIPFLPPSATVMEAMSEQMSGMIEGVLWSETSSPKKDNYKWDYQTLGNRKYINENGEIIEDVTRELDKKRIADIEENTIFSWDEFIQSHCSGCPSDNCGGKYFTAIAASICDELCSTNDE
mmetsp:Transcript_3148/g.5851  ORF Transcript_3148/g.5851 Transcript_3148/m.5851 type:complete len:439 (+) Transcript_3148:306-1622(+)